MLDPTATPDNVPFQVLQADMTVVKILTAVEQWPAGTFHRNFGYNTTGFLVYIGPYGPGSTGLVYGY